jgi:hypothetical protein
MGEKKGGRGGENSSCAGPVVLPLVWLFHALEEVDMRRRVGGCCQEGENRVIRLGGRMMWRERMRDMGRAAVVIVG